MKKFLTILGTLTIIGSTTVSVISCQTVSYSTEEDNRLKFFINLAEPGNENLTDQQILDNLTLQLNEFTKWELEYDTDFNIDTIKRDIRTDLVLAQKIRITPNRDSNKFTQEGVLYLKRNFDYMSDWFFAVNISDTADEIASRELESRVRNEFKRWAPDAEEARDYLISKDYVGNKKGNWTLYSKNSRLISDLYLTFKLSKK